MENNEEVVSEDNSGHPDYKLVPLGALNVTSRRQLSFALLPEKPFPTETGVGRDWQGLCELAGCNFDLIQKFKNDAEPVFSLLSHWDREQATVSNLIENLKLMDRYDVIDDLRTSIDRDVVAYLKNHKNHPFTNDPVPTIRSKSNSNATTVTQQLTVNDVLDNGESGEDRYDAYVSYMDSDAEFVVEMVKELEQRFKLKLFVKDRDLIPGVVEIHAYMSLINERCDKILLVVSEESLADPQCIYRAVIAQASAVDGSIYARKVIPIICRPCILPPQFKYLAKLDYTKKDHFGKFWIRLYSSIKSSLTDVYIPTTTIGERFDTTNGTATGYLMKTRNSLPDIVTPTSPEKQISSKGPLLTNMIPPKRKNSPASPNSSNEIPSANLLSVNSPTKSSPETIFESRSAPSSPFLSEKKLNPNKKKSPSPNKKNFLSKVFPSRGTSP